LTRMVHGDNGIGSHIWGLPSREFGAALQWTTNLPFPSTERVGFPSWSWAGWIHTNDYPPPKGSFHDMYRGFDKRDTDISVLTCYKVRDDNSIDTIETWNFERLLLQINEGAQRNRGFNDTTEITRLKLGILQNFTPKPCDELATYIELLSPPKPPRSHHIFLWANCASLYVDQPPRGVSHEMAWDLPIRIKERDRQIGSIRLNPEWRETQSDYMHFFVSTAGVYLPLGPATNPLQLKFKIILTELHLNMKPSVHRRIQVSHTAICQTDWLLAHPESRYIALV